MTSNQACKDKHSTNELRRLESLLSRKLGECVGDFGLIESGDRILVCLSGGKDSYTLLTLLERLRLRAPVRFSLVPYHLDQKQPGYDGAPLRNYLEEKGFSYEWEEEDTYGIVKDRIPEGKTYCSLCSRLRRGVIYNSAERLGCTKIALGHHRDDAIETLMLNMMFGGSLAAMPARYTAKDGRNTVIRPLLYCSETSIARFAELQNYPILPCNLCGSQDNLKRQSTKRMLAAMEKEAPQLRESMLAAMKHVKVDHLLGGNASEPQPEAGKALPEKQDVFSNEGMRLRVLS